MRLDATENEVKDEKNKIWLEEDDMELQVNFLEKKESYYLLNCRAIVEGEAYNNFEVEVELIDNDVDVTSIAQFLELEWECYDFVI